MSLLAALGRHYRALIVVTALWIAASMYGPYQGVLPIRSDGVGYHIWTKALKSGDFSFMKNAGAYSDFGCSSSELKNRCVNKYPVGVALLRFPLVAAFVDVSSPLTFSPAEQTFVKWFAGFLLIISGFLLIGVATRLGYSAASANLIFLAICFGTGWFHFATYDACFSHAYSAFWASCLIWTLTYLGQPRPLATTPRLLAGLLLFSTCAMLVMTRNTNLFLIAAGLAYLAFLPGRPALQRLKGPLALILVGTVTGILVQSSYNYYALGKFAVSSYSSEAFLFDQPMQWEVMFSYKKGLFLYYPVLALVIIHALMSRPARTLLLPAVIPTVALIILYGYWHTWWLGGGFGHRGFVEVAPFYFLPAVPALDGRRPRKLWAYSAYIVATLFCTWLMWQYWIGKLPFEGPTEERYWSYFH